MRNYKDETYYLRMPKKVKHVRFISSTNLEGLERNVNEFADSHPEYKILGIKLTIDAGVSVNLYVATVTYLCDAEDGISSDDYDAEDDED